MKLNRTVAPILAALAMTAAMPASAQTTHETKVTHDTGMKDGVPTATTKVVTVRKHKTRRPKKILGVKVGHKTRTTKVVREKTVDANGVVDQKVKVSH